MQIAPGTEITLHFALGIIDGDEVDSTFGGKPATFNYGDGSLLPGVEAKLLGLSAGASETFTLAPEEGVVISFADAARAELPGVVSEVSDESVMVDFNHPLAGRSLAFRVEILKVSAQAQAN